MNFNEAKYLIVDHFDSIKNQIDINIETLLDQACLGELGKILKMKRIENNEDRKSLNDIREKQLEKIDEFQQESLSQLNTLSQKDFDTVFAQLLNNSSLNSDHKIERVLSCFILNDLILIENPVTTSKQILCSFPGYLNRINEELTKYTHFIMFETIKIKIKLLINFFRDDPKVLNKVSFY